MNGPASVVVAGDAEALDELLDGLVAATGVRVRRIAVDYASHTRACRGRSARTLAEALAGIAPPAPAVPFYLDGDR